MRLAVALFAVSVASMGQVMPPTPNAANAATGSISGRVTDSVTGQPLDGATISLLQFRFQSGTRQRLEADSQADGSFRIDGVPPGSYALRAKRDGYVPSRLNGRVGMIELSAGQSMVDANVQLVPDATITGKLLDDAGKPVAGATIEAIEQTSQRGHTVAVRKALLETDRNGAFAVKELPPGDYFLMAKPDAANNQPTADGVLLRTFYPRALDLDTATPIQVAAGQSSGDITFYLRRGVSHHVRGKLTDMPANSRMLRVVWSPQSQVDSPALMERVDLGKNGTFDIDDVTPGAYTLRVFTRFRRLIARQDVQVGGADVEDVVITPQAPVVLTGKATLPENLPGPAPRIRVIVRPLDNPAFSRASVSDVQPDGSVQTSPLDPGSYLVQAIVTPASLYVQSISLNQQDVTDKAVDITEAGGSIEIVFGSDPATIAGTTSDGAAGTAVILVPNTVAPDGSNVQFTNTSSDGSFQFRNLRPGDYKVFATAVRDYGTWQNPDFLSRLQQQGTSVSVGPNQQQQVQVPLIDPELVQEAAGQIGLTLD